MHLTMQTPMQGSMQKQAAAFKWMMRIMSFMFLPAGGFVSAGTAVLWVSNSAFAVAQVILSCCNGLGNPIMLQWLR
jgi:membrane protein insertase Oxa1/YidC/SpoIIIJ